MIAIAAIWAGCALVAWALCAIGADPDAADRPLTPGALSRRGLPDGDRLTLPPPMDRVRLTYYGGPLDGDTDDLPLWTLGVQDYVRRGNLLVWVPLARAQGERERGAA